jgi:hypothetical protein
MGSIRNRSALLVGLPLPSSWAVPPSPAVAHYSCSAADPVHRGSVAVPIGDILENRIHPVD